MQMTSLFGNTMSFKHLLLALLSFPGFALAADCTVPPFEPLAFETKGNAPSDSLLVEMQPVATLRVPSGFSKVGVLPNGSLGLGQHPRHIRAVLGFETKASIAVHEIDGSPATFLLSVFSGANETACRYLQGYQLEAQDYRLHANIPGAQLFAFGKGDRHQFYLIRPDRPDLALSGLFRNITRSEFEAILSTLQTK